MSWRDHFSSSVCSYHFSIRNSGELLKTKIFVPHCLTFFLFRACQFCRKKNKLLTFPISDHIPHISILPIIFLSPWFSILSCLWHSCLNPFSCVQHIRLVDRHSSVIWGSHIHVCACPCFPLSNTIEIILFFKYYLFFACNSYKSIPWYLLHLYQGWGIK